MAGTGGRVAESKGGAVSNKGFVMPAERRERPVAGGNEWLKEGRQVEAVSNSHNSGVLMVLLTHPRSFFACHALYKRLRALQLSSHIVESTWMKIFGRDK